MMGALTKFTLRCLAESKVRTIVTIAGVALAAALLTAVATSVTSLSSYLYRSDIVSNGSWTAQVRVDDLDDSDVVPVGA